MAANDSNNLLTRVKEFAARMTPLQKIGLGAVLLTVIAGALVLNRTTSTSSMSPLYSNLSAADTSAVVDSLSSKNVNYELTDAGHTVLVPTDQVYDLRVSLAGAGLPSSSEGYSLLDKQGLTTSDFRQRIDYQRALEGELDKTLEAMDGIQSAAVHLALPEESVFVDTPTNPTASVLLVANGLGGIDPDSVEAVVHLVASSVKNMKPADVTVIDSSGAVLSTAGITGQSASGRTKAVTAFEQKMGAELTSLLQRTTGVGKVAVTVSADLQLDEVQSTSEDYGPIGEGDDSYVLAEQTADETYAGDTGENGTTGVLGPDGADNTATSLADPTAATEATSTTTATTDATGAATETTVPAATTVPGATTETETPASGSQYGSSSGSRTYGVDRVVEQTTYAPGKVLQLHVAVLVDDKAVDAKQATAIEDLVTTAAGIDADRGDSITVSRMPFDTSAQTEAAELAKADDASAKSAEQNQLYRTVAVAAVIIIALFLAYRSARRARRTTVTPINIGEVGVGRRNGGPVELPPAPTEAVAASSGDAQEDAMGEIAKVVDRRPEDVANVLRSWLADSSRHS